LGDVSTADLFCFNDLTGQISIDNIFGGIGPLNCLLTSEQSNWYAEVINNSVIFSGLPDGTFQITITDANQCTINENVVLSAPDLLAVEASGFLNEPITAQISGGTPPFTYLWCDASTSEFIILNNDPGSCLLQITDDNGCMATTEVDVNVGISENKNIQLTYYFIGNKLHFKSNLEIHSALLYDSIGKLCSPSMLPCLSIQNSNLTLLDSHQEFTSF
jgi:hypothetical protein